MKFISEICSDDTQHRASRQSAVSCCSTMEFMSIAGLRAGFATA